jgi:hypothetical protein
MNNFFEKIKSTIAAYPFVTILLILFPISYISLDKYCDLDRRITISENKAQDTVLANSYKSYTANDSSRYTARLHKSLLVVKARKDGALEDAVYYYEGIFFYSLLLGILSIFGSMLLVLLVKDGWTQTSNDIKATLAILFLSCSICYFIPRLVNNEQNYKDNIATYYVFSKQLVYSTNILTLHYCCDTSKDPGAILRQAADSNYNVVGNNLHMHYDINTTEASKNWDEFKSGMHDKTGKGNNQGAIR